MGRDNFTTEDTESGEKRKKEKTDYLNRRGLGIGYDAAVWREKVKR